jgi:hypothetical protein
MATSYLAWLHVNSLIHFHTVVCNFLFFFKFQYLQSHIELLPSHVKIKFILFMVPCRNISILQSHMRMLGMVTCIQKNHFIHGCI